MTAFCIAFFESYIFQRLRRIFSEFDKLRWSLLFKNIRVVELSLINKKIIQTRRRSRLHVFIWTSREHYNLSGFGPSHFLLKRWAASSNLPQKMKLIWVISCSVSDTLLSLSKATTELSSKNWTFFWLRRQIARDFALTKCAFCLGIGDQVQIRTYDWCRYLLIIQNYIRRPDLSEPQMNSSPSRLKDSFLNASKTFCLVLKEKKD